MFLENAILALFTPPCLGDQTCVHLQAEGGQWDPTLLGLSVNSKCLSMHL